MSVTFLQFDKRWRDILFPKRNKRRSTYGTSGCCPCFIAAILENYVPDILPTDVGDYISSIGGATQGGWHYWTTPPKAFKHWKVEAEQLNRNNLYKKRNTVAEKDFIQCLKDGGRGGILFGKSQFTAGGHYVACTDYRIRNGKFQVYLRDSGLRRKTGWWNWTAIQGKVKIFYIVPKQDKKKPEPPKPTKNKYTGRLPKLPSRLERLAVDCSYPYGTPKRVYKYVGGKPKPAYKTALEKAYPDRSAWGRQTRAGASCDVFVGTCVRAAGVSSKFPRGLAEQIPYLAKHFKRAKKRQAGDIAHRRNHIIIYVGLKGKLYRANAHHGGGGAYGIIEKDGAMQRYYRPAYKPSYLSKGDTFTGVKALQEFLKWKGLYSGAIDYSYGAKTEAAVKAYQQAKGLKVDGKVGVATLKAMRGDCT